MEMSLIFHIIALVLGFITGFIPILIKWNKARRDKKSAKTEAEKEKAEKEMREYLDELIIQAEKSFVVLDKVMKAQNSSAGSMKKKSVFTDLQAFAISKGFDFDIDFWSKKIDEIVAFTKEVNSK